VNFVALRMLTGDRAKYFGLVFAIAFCTFLLENQTSIFANILKRTASQILDVTDAEVWVMDPKTEYWEQTKALKDTDLTRVRGVPGTLWAVRLFKGNPVAKTLSGKFAVSFLVGLDDATLAGAPRQMLMGSWERLREPDSVVVDKAGYILLFPGEPLELGRTLEMNDHRVTIVGISDASAPFVSLPVMHARYSEAVNFLGRERTQLSFVIARPDPGVTRRSSPRASRTGRGSAPGPPTSSCGTASATISGTPAFPSTSASPSASRWSWARWSRARRSTSSP
jgi:putative ABC transport system permease protein